MLVETRLHTREVLFGYNMLRNVGSAYHTIKINIHVHVKNRIHSGGVCIN